MNNREAFETVKAHLLAQGKQARNEKGLCRYRTPDGLRCAVGCLIPDEEYDSDFEGKIVGELPYTPESLAGINLALLDDLQHVHDDFEPAEWAIELEKVSRCWGFDQ